jgi:hypothetical protein
MSDSQFFSVISGFSFCSFLSPCFPPKSCFRGIILSSQLGIDKLQFFLPVSEVRFSPEFTATLHGATDAVTGEALGERVLYVADGREFRGRKASLNTDNFNLTISPHRDGGEAVCVVHFSAGAYSDSNLQPLDLEECFLTAHHAENDLRERGADIDLKRAKLTRLDIARNVQLSHPVACYSPVFAALSCRARVDKKDFGGTGFLAGNKSWEIGFYDKGAEMQEKGHLPALCPKNTLRPELRLKKSANIRSAVGCDTLADLPKSWTELRTAYAHHLTRDVFKPKEEAAIDRTLDSYEMAATVVSGPLERKWQAFKSHSAPLYLVQEMGLEMAKYFAATQLGIDGETEAGKKQLYRINQELRHADFALRNNHVAPSGCKVKELHWEMRRAVMDF